VKSDNLRARALLGCAVLLLAGCSTLGVAGGGSGGTPKAAPGAAPKAAPPENASCRTLSRADLDHVINARLNRHDAAAFLKSVAIRDYDISEPGTNWMHGAIPGAKSSYSIYYFTYRQRYFILFLVDKPETCADALDAIILPRTSADYELGMGPTLIDTGVVAPDVIVIYSRKWDGNHSDDIKAAFRPNLETRQLEEYPRANLRMFREEP
jgi:hypothetical protein